MGPSAQTRSTPESLTVKPSACCSYFLDSTPILHNRVAQNARGVVKGVVKGVTRATFGRRAPLPPQLKRASTRRREEEVFRGVHMIQQVAAVHLGWGQAPSLDTK